MAKQLILINSKVAYCHTQLARWVVAILLSLAMLVQLAWFRSRASVTFDETFYLNSATLFKFPEEFHHNLAMHGVAPLPIWATWVPAVMIHRVEPRDRLWEGSLDDPPIVFTARMIQSLLVGLPLLWIVHFWLLRRRGLGWATAGGCLVCFSPNILAHAGLATTDALAALTWIVSLAIMSRALATSAALDYLAVGAAIGTAISAKYSGVLLVAIFFLIAIGYECRKHKLLFFGFAWNCCLCGISLCLVAWLWHGASFVTADARGVFANARETDQPAVKSWVERFEGKSLPAPIVGLIQQNRHNQRGQPAFLLDQTNMTGWWYYFPAVIWMKSTPSELILGLVLAGWWIFYLVQTLLKQKKGENASTLELQIARVLWSTTLILFGCFLLLMVRVQIGYRYALPLLPVAILLGVDSLANCSSKWPRAIWPLVCVLVGGQCVSSWMTGPHYLSYFSPMVGGSKNGYRLLADSNVDWGQDLPALSEQLIKYSEKRSVLSYFGTGLPLAYGVEADLLDEQSRDPLSGYDILAISTNNIRGLKVFEHRVDPKYRFLMDLVPIARAGDSILIFDIHRDRLRERFQLRTESKP